MPTHSTKPVDAPEDSLQTFKAALRSKMQQSAWCRRMIHYSLQVTIKTNLWQSLSTKHRTKSLTHQTGTYPVTCFNGSIRSHLLTAVAVPLSSWLAVEITLTSCCCLCQKQCTVIVNHNTNVFTMGSVTTYQVPGRGYQNHSRQRCPNSRDGAW